MLRSMAIAVLAVATAASGVLAADQAAPAAKPSWVQAVLDARAQAAGQAKDAAEPVAVAVGEPARKVSIDVTGWDELWLCVRNEAATGRDRHIAFWANPTLVDKDGKSSSLTRLHPAELRIGNAHLTTASREKPVRAADGQTYISGLLHRPGEMMYKLGGKFTRLEVELAVESGAPKKTALLFRVQRSSVHRLWEALEQAYPVQCDWLIQDLAAVGAAVQPPGADAGSYPVRFVTPQSEADLPGKMVLRAADELGQAAQAFRDRLAAAGTGPAADRTLLELYQAACQARRTARLKPLLAHCDKIVFTKHFNMGGSHYAYTEAVSDGVAERNFRPGTALCLLERSGDDYAVRTLIEDEKGVIRDPAVSHDARTVLFSWKKSDREDDYHLYDMDLAGGKVRTITSGLGHADYEADYLPNGDIVFNSTRCVQFVDCWITEVSNLYTCDRDGKYLRRLGFDQVHTNFPTVTHDGIVLYTRWEYNDRGQIYPQALFQMNPDGTGQTEFYGNNSYFPTTILHARSIPGTPKVVAIATGHHSRQTGKLIVIDPTKGRQENEGVQLIAPVRETKAERIDAYGQEGDLFQYPYAITPEVFLVAYHPWGWTSRDPKFGIYLMDQAGRRELLACDPKVSCNQPIPVAPRKAPPPRPSHVDYTRTSGTYYVQDVYAGPGLAGIPRGTVKKLRVVALEFRPVVAGGNGNGGPAGGAFVSTPVATGNGAWDPKIVLGEVDVQSDGSAFFVVPARTPVYFQCIDDRGCVVQTMRSWSTLMPGENSSCVGCHESKNSAPIPYNGSTLALKAGAKPLTPFHGPARGFSFAREIQPILDKNCIRCHNDRSKKLLPKGAGPASDGRSPAVDVSKVCQIVPIKSEWRYLDSAAPAGWEKEAFDDSAWKSGKGGFGGPGATRWRSPEIYLRKSVTLAADQVKMINSIVIWHDEDFQLFINGVLAAQKTGHRDDYTLMPLSPEARKALREGKNTLAVSCKQTAGGQYIDVGLADDMGLLNPRRQPEVARTDPAPARPADPGVKPAFSLTSAQVLDPKAKRKWTDAYIALTGSVANDAGEFRGRTSDLVNWISPQSAPPMLPPYSAGACKSRLLTLLEGGHNGVKLSRADLEKIACWIDLLVPFCGDYLEANTWSEEETKRFQRLDAKRKDQEALERKNIDALLQRAAK